MDDENDPQITTLIADAPNIPIEVRAALYTHLANLVWCLSVLMLAVVPYYYYQGPQVSTVGLIACSIAFSVFYILFALATANSRTTTAIVCGCLWTLATAGFVGFLSAVLFNIIAVQFISICFGQSIACVIYLQTVNIKRDEHIIWQWSVPFMVFASLVVWLASLYAFMVEDDWWFAGGLALASLAVVAYNAYGLARTEHYTMNEEGIRQAILDYYCQLAVAGIKRLQG